MHLLLVAGLFTARTTHVTREAEPVEVRFLSEMRTPQPQPPAPPVVVTEVPQLFVPTPEVTVAATAPVMVSAVSQVTSIVSDKGVNAPSSPPVISDVEYVKQPVSHYPPASKRLKEQGTVVLRVMVDEAGRAAQVNIHRSSGFPRLDAAACEAVRNALFKPYVREGQALAALVYVPIEFSLRDGHDERHGRRKALASTPIEPSSGA